MSLINAVRRNRAFTLIELIIVVVIIGILAAIAVPRMSRGASAAGESSLTANLTNLRNAIDMFQMEHDGKYPTLAKIEQCLTQYSNADFSTFKTTKDESTGVIFGPYMRSIPALPVGPNKGLNTFVATLGGSAGWVYDVATGTVQANVPAGNKDSKGNEFNTY